MFFNENLYFEDAPATEMTDDMVEEACASAQKEAENDPEATPVQEGMSLYAMALEEMSTLNESYYNLREKMMNIEHIASLKKERGLVSESNMILQESASSFLEKVKDLFKKMGNKIKELFNRFVNFVTGIFVTNKDIFNVDGSTAWDRNGANFKLKVKVLNLNPKQMYDIEGKAKDILTAVNTAIRNMEGSRDDSDDVSTIKNNIKRDLEIAYDNFTSKAKTAKTAVAEYVFSTLGNNDGNNTVLGRVETEIDKPDFLMRLEYAKKYEKAIVQVKETKKEALDAINESIKKLNELKRNEDTDKASITSVVIAGLRKLSSTAYSIFSKLISVAHDYYRECMSISRRVIASGKVAEKKKKLKSEGFDFDAYFA